MPGEVHGGKTTTYGEVGFAEVDVKLNGMDSLKRGLRVKPPSITGG